MTFSRINGSGETACVEVITHPNKQGNAILISNLTMITEIVRAIHGTLPSMADAPLKYPVSTALNTVQYDPSNMTSVNYPDDISRHRLMVDRGFAEGTVWAPLLKMILVLRKLISD